MSRVKKKSGQVIDPETNEEQRIPGVRHQRVGHAHERGITIFPAIIPANDVQNINNNVNTGPYGYSQSAGNLNQGREIANRRLARNQRRIGVVRRPSHDQKQVERSRGVPRWQQLYSTRTSKSCTKECDILGSGQASSREGTRVHGSADFLQELISDESSTSEDCDGNNLSDYDNLVGMPDCQYEDGFNDCSLPESSNVPSTSYPYSRDTFHGRGQRSIIECLTSTPRSVSYISNSDCNEGDTIRDCDINPFEYDSLEDTSMNQTESISIHLNISQVTTESSEVQTQFYEDNNRVLSQISSVTGNQGPCSETREPLHPTKSERLKLEIPSMEKKIDKLDNVRGDSSSILMKNYLCQMPIGSQEMDANCSGQSYSYLTETETPGKESAAIDESPVIMLQISHEKESKYERRDHNDVYYQDGTLVDVMDDVEDIHMREKPVASPDVNFATCQSDAIEKKTARGTAETVGNAPDTESMDKEEIISLFNDSEDEIDKAKKGSAGIVSEDKVSNGDNRSHDLGKAGIGKDNRSHDLGKAGIGKDNRSHDLGKAGIGKDNRSHDLEKAGIGKDNRSHDLGKAGIGKDNRSHDLGKAGIGKDNRSHDLGKAGFGKDNGKMASDNNASPVEALNNSEAEDRYDALSPNTSMSVSPRNERQSDVEYFTESDEMMNDGVVTLPCCSMDPNDTEEEAWFDEVKRLGEESICFDGRKQNEEPGTSNETRLEEPRSGCLPDDSVKCAMNDLTGNNLDLGDVKMSNHGQSAASLAKEEVTTTGASTYGPTKSSLDETKHPEIKNKRVTIDSVKKSDIDKTISSGPTPPSGTRMRVGKIKKVTTDDYESPHEAKSHKPDFLSFLLSLKDESSENQTVETSTTRKPKQTHKPTMEHTIPNVEPNFKEEKERDKEENTARNEPRFPRGVDTAPSWAPTPSLSMENIQALNRFKRLMTSKRKNKPPKQKRKPKKTARKKKVQFSANAPSKTTGQLSSKPSSSSEEEQEMERERYLEEKEGKTKNEIAKPEGEKEQVGDHTESGDADKEESNRRYEEYDTTLRDLSRYNYIDALIEDRGIEEMLRLETMLNYLEPKLKTEHSKRSKMVTKSGTKMAADAASSGDQIVVTESNIRIQRVAQTAPSIINQSRLGTLRLRRDSSKSKELGMWEHENPQIYAEIWPEQGDILEGKPPAMAYALDKDEKDREKEMACVIEPDAETNEESDKKAQADMQMTYLDLLQSKELTVPTPFNSDRNLSPRRKTKSVGDSSLLHPASRSNIGDRFRKARLVSCRRRADSTSRSESQESKKMISFCLDDDAGQEDHWSTSVSTMLLRAEKVKKENKGNADNRFPRSDSADVVHPVQGQGAGFLSHLLEQDRQEQRHRSRISHGDKERPKSKKRRKRVNKTEQNSQCRYRYSRNIPDEMPLQKLPQILSAENFEPSPNSAGILKIKTSASLAAQRRAFLTHFRIGTLLKANEAGAQAKFKSMRYGKPCSGPSSRWDDRPIGNGVAMTAAARNSLFPRVRNVKSTSEKQEDGASCNFILDRYSDVFQYYNAPFLKERRTSVQDVFSNRNSNALGAGSRGWEFPVGFGERGRITEPFQQDSVFGITVPKRSTKSVTFNLDPQTTIESNKQCCSNIKRMPHIYLKYGIVDDADSLTLMDYNLHHSDDKELIENECEEILAAPTNNLQETDEINQYADSKTENCKLLKEIEKEIMEQNNPDRCLEKVQERKSIIKNVNTNRSTKKNRAKDNESKETRKESFKNNIMSNIGAKWASQSLASRIRLQKKYQQRPDTTPRDNDEQIDVKSLNILVTGKPIHACKRLNTKPLSQHKLQTQLMSSLNAKMWRDLGFWKMSGIDMFVTGKTMGPPPDGNETSTGKRIRERGDIPCCPSLESQNESDEELIDRVCQATTGKSQTSRSPKQRKARFIRKDFLRMLRKPDLVWYINLNEENLKNSLRTVTHKTHFLPVFQIASVKPASVLKGIVLLHFCTDPEKFDPYMTYGSDDDEEEEEAKSIFLFYTPETEDSFASLFTVQDVTKGLYSLERIEFHQPSKPKLTRTRSSADFNAKPGRFVRLPRGHFDRIEDMIGLYIVSSWFSNEEAAYTYLVRSVDLLGNDIYGYLQNILNWPDTFPQERRFNSPLTQYYDSDSKNFKLFGKGLYTPTEELLTPSQNKLRSSFVLSPNDTDNYLLRGDTSYISSISSIYSGQPSGYELHRRQEAKKYQVRLFAIQCEMMENKWRARSNLIVSRSEENVKPPKESPSTTSVMSDANFQKIKHSNCGSVISYCSGPRPNFSFRTEYSIKDDESNCTISNWSTNKSMVFVTPPRYPKTDKPKKANTRKYSSWNTNLRCRNTYRHRQPTTMRTKTRTRPKRLVIMQSDSSSSSPTSSSSSEETSDSDSTITRPRRIKKDTVVLRSIGEGPAAHAIRVGKIQEMEKQKKDEEKLEERHQIKYVKKIGSLTVNQRYSEPLPQYQKPDFRAELQQTKSEFDLCSDAHLIKELWRDVFPLEPAQHKPGNKPLKFKTYLN